MGKPKKLILRAWFELTPQERWIVGFIMLIALVGIWARHQYLRGLESEPYEPVGIEQIESSKN